MSGTMRHEGFDYMDLDDFEEMLADKPAHEKWELIGGRVVRMMVGARWELKRIVQNITSYLLTGFRQRGSDCRPYDEIFFLKKPDLKLAALPDVMVKCGALEPGATSIGDPVVCFEVLSEGSAARDRIEKWSVYRQLPSLKHYVLVERDRSVVEVLSRVGPVWSDMRVVEAAEDVVHLPAIDVMLPIRIIYEDVLFS
jgi:Uma2 family endonuclease